MNYSSKAQSCLVFVLVGTLVTGCDEHMGVAEASSPSGTTRAEVSGPNQTGSVASVSELEGDVRVRLATSANWDAVNLGHPLFAGESVQTMDDATATVLFPATGVSTAMEPLTALLIPEQAPRVSRLRHLSGRLRARLDPGGGVERLEVALPPGQLVLDESGSGLHGYVEARIDIRAELSEIAMLSGQARLSLGAGPATAIAEARYIQVTADGTIVEEGADVPPPAELTEPALGAEITTRGMVTLRWTPTDVATGYRVDLQSDDGRQIEHLAVRSSARIALSTGTYSWRVRALTERGPGHISDAATFRVRVDRAAPRLSLSSPAQGQALAGVNAVVAGRTESGAQVQVNGRSVPVATDGSFRTETAVRSGLTNIVVTVRDPAGNARTMTRSVLREQ